MKIIGPALLPVGQREDDPNWRREVERYHAKAADQNFSRSDFHRLREGFTRRCGRNSYTFDWYTLQWALDEYEGLHLETKMSDHASDEYADVIKAQEIWDSL